MEVEPNLSIAEEERVKHRDAERLPRAVETRSGPVCVPVNVVRVITTSPCGWRDITSIRQSALEATDSSIVAARRESGAS